MTHTNEKLYLIRENLAKLETCVIQLREVSTPYSCGHEPSRWIFPPSSSLSKQSSLNMPKTFL